MTDATDMISGSHLPALPEGLLKSIEGLQMEFPFLQSIHQAVLNCAQLVYKSGIDRVAAVLQV